MGSSVVAGADFLRTLIEAMPCPVTVWDGSGRVVLQNAAAARRRPAADAAACRQPTSEVLLPQPDGSSRWVRLERVPVVLENGDPAVMVVEHDVHELVTARQAERHSRAKSQFVASLSHELRTPLNSILGFSQLLTESDCGPLTDKQRRYLENLRNSGRQLLELVNDALDLSRVEAGQLQMLFETFDLKDLLEETAVTVQPLIAAKAQRFTLEAAAGLRLRADRRRYQQSVLNLVANAIKFTPPEGRITVSAGLSAGSVKVTVTDSGIGIPSAEQERIFEEFVQVDPRLTRQEGSGLGLALARKLIEAMGGRVELERSELNCGSTFSIQMPAA